ncbi:MAG: MlaD family protein [Bacteroidota bacterium]
MNLSKEVKFGIYAIIAILAAIYGLSYMKGSNILGSTMRLVVVYDNVNGLVRGNSIMMKGLSVGRVMKMDLVDDKVTVQLELDQERFIPVDSRADIYNADLLGTKAVEIIKGQSSRMLEDGDTISGSIAETAFDKAQDLFDKDGTEIIGEIKKLSQELTKIARVVSSSLEQFEGGNDIEAIVKNLNQTTANIASITGQVDQLTQSTNSVVVSAGNVVGNIDENEPNINGIIKNVGTSTDKLAEASPDIKKLTQEAQAAVAQLNALTQQINSDSSSLGLLIRERELYDNLNGSIGNANDLLEAIKKNPQKYLDVDVYVFERKKKK